MRPQADIKSAPPEIEFATSEANRLGEDKLNVNLSVIMNFHHVIISIIFASTLIIS